MRTGTLARLCVRKKFGNVRVRTVALSQFKGGGPAQGLQRNLAARSQERSLAAFSRKMAGKAVDRDRLDANT
jgi:hypothetical protein